ncbi:2-dehydro-3-deoxygalactonokinase [Sphingomonas sp. SFZ2018-12]|uniref:2-dehydro-3-deoxygalactonokinase n=1 Tax=Sphingomonas sp. SFZ2018-12 TaxID=2683197 RepID=UPI001F0FAB7F|nr:2-dehydro-3-deoxygalactonokinase [Sphingomonas sp. SFZ2018-12]MCH4893275.1 2-dehydro-3-deoxygalactonokinase [Sphingomonas sp. SFZ2018-12]
MSVATRERLVGDWGTTRLRLFHLRGDAIVDRVEGPGIGVADAPPTDVLATVLTRWRGAERARDVTLCGMVGSRNGLVETGYADAPAGVADWAAAAQRIVLDGFRITIAPGVACRRDDGAADVMRGEETQIFGAMALDPALSRGRHLIALPGTHGKWARVADGRIVSFRTYLTGELFALLRDRSTLLRVGDDPADEAEGFAAGLARIGGGDLAGSLFETRAAQLRDGRSAGWAAGFLSGLLIGTEVQGGVGDARAVVLVGAPALVARYRSVLDGMAIATTVLDGDACAIAGLARLGALDEERAR